MKSTSDTRPIRDSLREYGRGIAGGLIFSFPLLYTMEVWWAGFTASPVQLIVMILFTFVLLLGYNRYAGMHPESTWKNILVESVEELGIGFMLAFGTMYMLRRLDFITMSADEIIGKVIIEAMVVSIGVSVGTAQLGIGPSEEDAAQQGLPAEDRHNGLRSLFILALCGSIVIGGNVAPTEEILVIASESRPLHIMVMVMASLVLSVLILFYVDFEGSTPHSAPQTDFFTLTLETTFCYLTALGASALLLWFFGRLSGVSFWTAFSQCITLGVLASLGASAGRLLIK